MPPDPRKQPELRIVKGGRQPTLAEALLQPTPLELDAGEPLPRGKKLYGQVPMGWLRDRAKDRYLSREMRLYQYLQIKSRRGSRAIRLTNEMAGEVGLDRHQKTRALQVLEADGFITVTRSGKRLPVVVVRRLDHSDF